MNFSIFEESDTMGLPDIWEIGGGSSGGRGGGYQDRQGFIRNLNNDDWNFDNGSLNPGEFIPYTPQIAVPIVNGNVEAQPIIPELASVPATAPAGQPILQTASVPPKAPATKTDDTDSDEDGLIGVIDIKTLAIGGGILIVGILLLTGRK